MIEHERTTDYDTTEKAIFERIVKKEGPAMDEIIHPILAADKQRARRVRAVFGLAAIGLLSAAIHGITGHFGNETSIEDSRAANYASAKHMIGSTILHDGFNPINVHFEREPTYRATFSQQVSSCVIALEATRTTVLSPADVAPKMSMNSYTLILNGEESDHTYTGYDDLTTKLGPDVCSNVSSLADYEQGS